MPKQKDLKRLVRARMEKTGEAYTAARKRILEKKSPVPAVDFAAIAGMSDNAVREKTGCSWAEWVEHLDYVKASEMSHREIARHVAEKFDVSGWWAQTVTVGYERIRGLRQKGQRRGGSWEVSKSKTVSVSLSRLYKAVRDTRLRKRWLPDVDLKVRKATPNKSMRVTWPDGTSLHVYFYEKGDEKSQVTIQHVGLPTKGAADNARTYWGERLTELARFVEGSAISRSMSG